MKRPTRKSPKKSPPRQAAKAPKPARRAVPAAPARRKAATARAKVVPPRPAAPQARASPPQTRVAPGRAAQPAALRRGQQPPRNNGPLPEGDRQLSDPVEAAQEDPRAPPERALFDRDDSGRDDDLAEMLGEEYVRSVTSGEEQGVELRDEEVPEEEGGPFVETSGQKEFANTEDDSEVEALPTVRAPRTRLLR